MCRILHLSPSSVGVSVLLAAVIMTSLPAASPTLEGRWRLVEQHYGNGTANLADLARPVRLELVRETAGAESRIWAGDFAGAAYRWPAYVADSGPIPVTIMERSVDPAQQVARAHYRVRPAPGDELILDIVESYELTADGDGLQGTVTVRFLSNTRPRGSFVLHRRFEREP